MDFLNAHDGPQGGKVSVGRLERPTITQRLKERKEHLEIELKQVSETLAILEKHPETQFVIDQLAKLNF